MIRTFTPCLTILPPAQQQLWPALRPAPQLGFVLYGGTAIALRLGHRPSLDYDFSTDQPVSKDRLYSESLKALVYFEGGDLHRLTHEERAFLIEAASSVRALPTVDIRGHALALSESP